MQELWDLIDLGTGTIEVDQFAQALRIIAGEVKAKDLFTINRRLAAGLSREHKGRSSSSYAGVILLLIIMLQYPQLLHSPNLEPLNPTESLCRTA